MTSPRRPVSSPTPSGFVFKPVNAAQREALDAFRDNDVIILIGPAGSGKTHVAAALCGLALQAKVTDRIVLTRPVVPAGEEIGFLPGTLDEKMLPWVLPFYDVLSRLTFTKPADFFSQHVEIAPLAFLRGRTFDRCVAVLDEAQNCTFSQLKLFLTRIGHKGKLILTGDTEQADIKDSGLLDVYWRLQRLPGVACIHLPSDDCPRHSLIPTLLNRLS